MVKGHILINRQHKRAVYGSCGSTSNSGCTAAYFNGTTEASAPTIYLKFTSDNGDTQEILYTIEQINDNMTNTNVNSFTFFRFSIYLLNINFLFSLISSILSS